MTNKYLHFADQTTQDKPTSHRFQKLSDKEVQEILDFDIQSKATKQNTKWGIKILQGVYDCFGHIYAPNRKSPLIIFNIFS